MVRGDGPHFLHPRVPADEEVALTQRLRTTHEPGNLLADAGLLASIGEFGVTQAKLEAGQAQVDAVEAANQVQEKERGEAQDATKARDAALDALDGWMSDFVAIARVALEEHPQYLEMLSIVAPS